MSGRPLRPPRRAAVGCVLAATLLAAHAHAADPPPRPGRFQVGPFWLTPRVELRGAGRDTNVYNQQFDPVSDAAAVLSPSLDVALPVGNRFRFSTRGFLNVNWFGDETSQRSTDRGFSTRGEADLGPLTLFARTARGWYKRRFTIDLDERLPYVESSQGFGTKVRISRRLSAAASLDTGRFAIEDSATRPDVDVTLDRDTRAFQVEGRYALTRRTNLVGSAEWLRDAFDEAVGASTSEADSSRYLAGLEFSSRALTGRLLGGVRSFPSSGDAAAPPYTGPAVQASLRFPVASRARLQLEAEREVYYAALPVLETGGAARRNSYVSWRSRAELSVELPFDLLTRLLLGYEAADYVLAYPTADGNDASSRWTYGGTLLRAIGEHLRVGGGINWESRSGHSVITPYHGARWGLQAEFVP